MECVPRVSARDVRLNNQHLAILRRNVVQNQPEIISKTLHGANMSSENSPLADISVG